MSAPVFEELAVGDVVATTTLRFDRLRLVRYAGASGDFNRIHWDEAFATGVGLPNVIVHGMLTMGAAVGVVEEWAGDPGRVVDYQTRFTRPVPVPATEVVEVEVSAAVGALDAQARTARVDLTVSFGAVKVLGKAQALVRLDA
ncbi:MaoC domain protein dehydratase [Xylanimonas cellulosilytica DSM 15894]|uniref:MaoC domain protein dehydratase n=1 Tax=Xylanimonas cellulosilytica (strain DSM 15894 / JCM 12276 / CECT 5975 / KCTC 9989 / LMG 20990 / NBRC 107835 / XIL07) TaxID=446471 RepID=D1BWQ7_XYLCX|nr:MaoC/PaaZ C-terminal domain-containing protein [Xylanimonas cellulosilytica]ACZ29639.1 MaoC domain protein dehydratase [Xylanimonas cellulosilytica DSM 15894]